MILVSKTYSIVTPESAEYGECAEQGFLSEDIPYTFKELVRELENYRCPSQSRGCDTRTWFETYPEVDYRRGYEEIRGVHYSRRNQPRSAKYWVKAARYAGLIK